MLLPAGGLHDRGDWWCPSVRTAFSTADCLDDEDAGDFADAAFVAAALVAAVGFDEPGRCAWRGVFTVRDDCVRSLRI